MAWLARTINHESLLLSVMEIFLKIKILLSCKISSAKRKVSETFKNNFLNLKDLLFHLNVKLDAER